MEASKISDIKMNVKLVPMGFNDLVHLVGESPDRISRLISEEPSKSKREKIVTSLAKDINRELSKLETTEGFQFATNRHHGELKKCFDRNYCCLRRALKKPDSITSVSLIIVPLEKENSQTRKRSLSISNVESTSELPNPVSVISFENLQASEKLLSPSQKLAMLAIANDKNFDRSKSRRIVEIVEERGVEVADDVQRLSQKLEDSQISNYSEELNKPKEEKLLISNNEMKALSLKLCCENDIPASTIHTVITELSNVIDEPSFRPFSERTIRLYVPCLQPLLDQQAEALIARSTALSIGTDSTSLAAKEYNSFTIRNSEGDSLILHVEFLPDHKAQTVLGSFERKFQSFSPEVQAALAMRVQSLNTDRAPAALAACDLIVKFLDSHFKRERSIIPCSMHCHMRQEKKLRESLTDRCKQIVKCAEKHLTKSRTHSGKKMKGEQFETYLEAKKLSDPDVLPEALGLYSNVRFAVFSRNLALLAITTTTQQPFSRTVAKKQTSLPLFDQKRQI